VDGCLQILQSVYELGEHKARRDLMEWRRLEKIAAKKAMYLARYVQAQGSLVCELG
jgi:hypothetical protein